jgi:hypothetical protein
VGAAVCGAVGLAVSIALPTTENNRLPA